MQPEQVLAWLATQATPDQGETSPPLPADLLSDIKQTFGIAPEPAPSGVERVGLWQKITELFSSRGLMAWSGTLAAACVVALLVWQYVSPKTMGQPGGDDPILRGGTPATTVPGISWHWIGLENFPAEQSKLTKEELTQEIPQSVFVVTLDALADPLQVLVTTTKNGTAQPNFSLKLPKQPAPAMRAGIWVKALQELQTKLQTAE
jgi:hypothetical protein